MMENSSMSTLQIGLIIAGVVLLVAVFAFNSWSSRRNSPRQADPEPEREDFDYSLPRTMYGEIERRDPVFEPGAGDATTQDERVPATVDIDLTSPQVASPPATDRRAALDPLIDVIAAIALDSPVSGDAALQAAPTTRRVGSKPFALEGLNAESNQWQTPRSGERYSALQAGVQMANRTGALNEIEFSEFVVKTQAFADAVGGAPDFPEMLHEVARARELDQFASDHDAQLGFKVHARGTAWSPGYVQQQAARLGFLPGAIPGRLVLPAREPGLPPLLTLLFDTQAALAEDPTQAAIHEVGLSLDVPQAERAARPFTRMREVAAALAQAMEGIVTDERSQPLGSAAMDQIESEVEKLYDQLDAHELSAGSALARRLFS